MYKSYREAAIDKIESAMNDALYFISQWCEVEGIEYSTTDLISVAKLILEEEHRDRERARS